MANAIRFTPEGGNITVGRFWQSKDSSRLGMGLGLSIARAIVELHGGTIWVESHLGEGALFQFTLPKQEEGDGSAPLH